jgi:hypothetical protein
MPEKRKPPEDADRPDDEPDIWGELPDIERLFQRAVEQAEDDEVDDDREGIYPNRLLAGYAITLTNPAGLPILRFTFLGDGTMRGAAVATQSAVDRAMVNEVAYHISEGWEVRDEGEDE